MPNEHLLKIDFISTHSLQTIKTLRMVVNYKYTCQGGGTVGYNVRPARGLLDVRNPVATDLYVKAGRDNSTAKRSALDVSVTGPWK